MGEQTKLVLSIQWITNDSCVVHMTSQDDLMMCASLIVNDQFYPSNRISSTVWKRNSFMCVPTARVMVKDMTS